MQYLEMKSMSSVGRFPTHIVFVLAASLLTCPAAFKCMAQASPTVPCANLPHSDHPSARLSNGKLTAVVYLPGKERGYYRGSRFDWAGIVGCVAMEGHTFFGEWFNHYDPMINDAVTGPVEEFRHPSSELGYDEAAPGGLFLKIGVGVLRRLDTAPYRFGGAYPIVDGGKWTVKVHGRSITFRQELHSTIGYAYLYEKVLTLDKHGAVLSLVHHLRNLGAKPLETFVYDHDFYMLDGKPTGPGMEVHLPFVPVPDKPFPEAVQIDGTTIRFIAPPQRTGRTVGSYITGFSGNASDYDMTFEDKELGIGVEQTSDSPMAKAYLWATPKTVCPEAYIAIKVAPKQTQQWTIHYRFFSTKAQSHPGVAGL
jgi:hypothetical protein